MLFYYSYFFELAEMSAWGGDHPGTIAEFLPAIYTDKYVHVHLVSISRRFAASRSSSVRAETIFNDIISNKSKQIKIQWREIGTSCGP